MGKPFPGLTARLFLRLYGTPPGRKWNDTHQRTLEKATVSDKIIHKYPFDPAPLRIRTYHWGQPGKRILLLHGWADTVLSFGGLIDGLVAAGYEVFAYDAPAHGHSGGKRTNLIQWGHALDQVTRDEGPFHAIVAHSMGALNAALVLARGQHRVPALVMVAPSLSAPAFFYDAFRIFKIRPKVHERVFGLIRKNLRTDALELDLHRYIGGIGADRILMIYDENDQMVPYTDLESYLKQYPSIDACRIRGGGHFRIMKNPEVIEKITALLGNFVVHHPYLPL